MPLIDVLAWISVLGYEFYYISKILIKVKNKEIQDKNSQNWQAYGYVFSGHVGKLT